MLHIVKGLRLPQNQWAIPGSAGAFVDGVGKSCCWLWNGGVLLKMVVRRLDFIGIL
jgi:hypothetical protein